MTNTNITPEAKRAISTTQRGIMLAISTYVMWGLMPLFWKLLDSVNAVEILMHRMVWSAVCMLLVVLIMKLDIVRYIKNPKTLGAIALAGLFVSINWGTYIYAVNSGHILQSSLGYYINPLMSVLVGVWFFKERLTRMQIVALGLAVIGVSISVIAYGQMPWLSLAIAGSFTVYSLIKKKIGLPAIEGLAIETLLTALFALVGLFILNAHGVRSFMAGPLSHPDVIKVTILLIFAGPLTAIPLVLFNKAANMAPLSYIGFTQYIAPTLAFFLAVFVFNEHMSMDKVACFAFIWTGLALIIAEAIALNHKGSRTLNGKRIEEIAQAARSKASAKE